MSVDALVDYFDNLSFSNAEFSVATRRISPEDMEAEEVQSPPVTPLRKPQAEHSLVVPRAPGVPCTHEAAIFRRLIADKEDVLFVGESQNRSLPIALAIMRGEWHGIWASDFDAPWEYRWIAQPLRSDQFWRSVERRIADASGSTNLGDSHQNRADAIDLFRDLEVLTACLDEEEGHEINSRLSITSVDARKLPTTIPTKRNIWFQCPRTARADVPRLIQQFIQSAARLQSPGDAVIIGIPNHPAYYADYKWPDALVCARKVGYNHVPSGACFIRRALDAGYYHRVSPALGNRTIHEKILRHHELHLFVRQ
ncbi:hypothetical protein MKEN_01459600 [Mycena kentingensis (nom. inval.)]|nr:hypothetical protein MKEN_01459600 [Mycena kentingensis (nom. inval.)]